MNIKLEKLVIIKEQKETREVTFREGLNIITGFSKTGKSAILEIVDFCLFSSVQTIPKGAITDFGDVFVLVLKIGEQFLVIGRPSLEKQEGNKAYFCIESDKNKIKNFPANYFRNSVLRTVNGDVKDEVSRYLGLEVKDTRPSNQDEKKNYGKATIRNVTSFIFQHQNLIANKHSMFYRFDDYYRRKDTVEQFPILVGWVDNKFYSLKRKLQETVDQIKSEERLIERNSRTQKELKDELQAIIGGYFKKIGLVLKEDQALKELKKIANDLPEVDEMSNANQDLNREIKDLERIQADLTEELSGIKIEISELEDLDSQSLTYGRRMLELNQLAQEPEEVQVTCPLCSASVEEVNSELEIVTQSKQKLISELTKTGVYKKDNSDLLEGLRKERDKLKREIRKVTGQYKDLIATNKEYERNQRVRDKLMVQKGETQSVINQILKANSIAKSGSDLEALRLKQSKIQKAINNYNLPNKIKEANDFVSSRMNEVARQLDFEKELKSGEMKFDLSNFNFFFEHEKFKKITMSEMGSGANWLACHLSLFVSLLHLSCKESKSSIPKVLFIDQPSQVYFPSSRNGVKKRPVNDENIKQVKNIFAVLDKELKKIKKDCGYLPQIIVLEHADEPEFDKFVIKRWNENGEKLI